VPEVEQMDFDVRYGITRRLRGVAFDKARELTEAALASEGFGVLTVIDVSATMKAKLGLDMPPYLILGACNPKLAHRAISDEPAIGLLLPCNVVIAQSGDEVVVSAASPKAMFAAVDKPSAALEAVAEEAGERIGRAMERVTS
jgi:uncharacterized protein (DUF302 family)